MRPSVEWVTKAPFGLASLLIALGVVVFLVVRFVDVLSSGYEATEAVRQTFAVLLPLNGSLALAPALVSLPLGIVSLVRRESPRWGLAGVILSAALLVAGAIMLLLYVVLLASALTQNW